MCGIAGLIGLAGASIDASQASTMSRLLAHRGPDGAGFVVLEGLGRPTRSDRPPSSRPARLAVAHRRLAILDLSEAAAQPMIDDRGRILVYNGEIYNYVELRDELVQAGFSFRSTGDTEVVLAAYDRWGPACVERFNGMWALALWDEPTGRLFCSRDRFGIKPFYYASAGDRFLFASEIKALAAVLATRPDVSTCVRFFRFDEFDVGESTFHDGIRQLLPGHNLIVVPRSGSVASKPYWTLAARPERRPRRPAESVRRLLEDSVRLRLRSDVPVGTCLSGGIDSSTLVGLVAGHEEARLLTFSALFAERGLDEGRFVRLVLDRYRATPFDVRPGPAGLAASFDRMIHHQDEPVRAPGVYPQWEVMNLAAGRVKVLLDGQGADEVFGGYLYFFAPYLRSLLGRGPTGVLRLAGLLPFLAPLALANRRVLAFYSPRAIASRLLLDRRSRTGDGVLRTGAGEGIAPTPIPEPDATDPLARALIRAITRTSLPALLHYEDRSSMAHSIEARTPFLDYRLVELSLDLGPEDWIDRTRTKAVLRRAARPVLPRPILDRRDKLGFSTPFDDWARGPLSSFVADRILGPTSADDLLDAAAVRRIWNEHQAGRNRGGLLWKILTYRSWLAQLPRGA